MKLIRKLGTRTNKNGYLISYAIFWCEYCESEIEKQLGNGLRDKFCGCMKGKFVIQQKTKHKETKTKLYRVWSNMKNRCHNFKSKDFPNYGGRGITICDEWLEYIPFKDWALNNGYKDNLTIDRIDNNKGYYPENCHFITSKENNRNRRSTKLTLEKANKIRTLCNSGYYTQKKLVEKYDVGQYTISRIINNKIWI